MDVLLTQTVVVAPATVEPTLHRLLRRELKNHNWSMSQLAKAVRVQPGVASRWISCDQSKRVIPRPDKCAELAHVLGLDLNEVFRAAGYLPELDGQPTEEESQRESDIRALNRRFDQIVRQMPAVMWPVTLSVANVTLDSLQNVYSRIQQFMQNFD